MSGGGRGGGGGRYGGGGGYGGGRYGGGGDRGYGGGRGGRGGGGYDDRYGGGRGGGGYRGGRGGGRFDDGGRGGRGGGAGRGRGPDLSGLQSALSNIVLANLTPNFQFFLYGVHCEDASGDLIDSRHRRRFLFDHGFWDGLLKDMPDKEREDLRRVVFFSGSFFFSGRPIPGVEARNLPLTLPVGPKAEGDVIRIMKMEHYIAPSEFSVRRPDVNADEVSFDNRCADCTKAFADIGSLLQHCQHAGHKPVYSLEDTDIGRDIVAKPAQIEVFISYVNQALQRALGERLARWGTEFIDPSNVSEPVDRNGNNLGVRVYEAFSCQFGILRSPQGIATLSLTIDLRAKIVRTMSVLDHLRGNLDARQYNPGYSEQERAKRDWIGQVVISMHDKKCYAVTDLIFSQSPRSMPIEGLGISHLEYFEKRKGIPIKYPDVKPMIAVLGRRNQTIFLPAELVAGNELERRVKEQLPMIASFKPDARNAAIEKIRNFLVPGAQKSKGAGGLLPALGIQLHDGRLGVKAHVLPLPMMMAGGIQVPKDKGENWAPLLNRANFNVGPRQANTLNVILVYNERLERGAQDVYNKIRDSVNRFNATYRFADNPMQLIRAGDRERHWGPVEQFFSDPKLKSENIFVLDFNKPKGTTDPAYPVVKQLLAKNGYLSQFVNFSNYSHDNPRDLKKSNIILQGVARQIIQKTGTRLWWVNIPASLPTPSVFVGVDVFHAPRVYDPKEKRKVAKASCAAIIVQVYRSASDNRAQVELYSETHAREPGKEYELGDALRTTISTALKELNVNPKSCIVWRDGIGDSAFKHAAAEEIAGIKAGLDGGGPVGTAGPGRDVPLSYIVCQKRVDTKFLTKGLRDEPDGKYGAPSGTLVEGIQGLNFDTFYINGRAPPYSTAKPVRFIIVRKDNEFKQVPIEQLTWDLCHDYPNWAGPIKVPSVCQMAHKLAELGGGFVDCGRTIESKKLKNTVHFL